MAEATMDEGARKEMLAALLAATNRVRSGEVESAEITMPDGGVVRLARDDEVPGGFRVESRATEDGKGLTGRSYPAAGVRPASYPEELPFLPGCAVSVSEVASGRMRSAIWMKPDDPDAAFGEIHRMLLDMKWVERPSIQILLAPGQLRQGTYERSGREGTLLHQTFNDTDQIMWMERRAETA